MKPTYLLLDYLQPPQIKFNVKGSLLMAVVRGGNSRGEQQATPRQQTPTWVPGSRAQLPGWLFKESNVVQSTLSWNSEEVLGEQEGQADPFHPPSHH